jgi:hypothetical protein
MSNLKTYISGDASTPGLPKEDTGSVRIDPGPYIGIVKSNQDPTYMGRLAVNIPTLTKTYQPTTGQLITCEYLSPYYGAKTTKYIEDKDPYSYQGSQHSYGMWMVPPDIDSKVLVIFVEGRPDQAFWIGCIQDPLVNHMIPGIAATDKTGMPSTSGESDSKQSMYGTDVLPAGEINRNMLDSVGGRPADPVLKRPIHPFAETLRQQGLVQDNVRGTTTSSARRETPSNVFGISTPGRRDPSSAEKIVGVRDSQNKEILDRLTGHTFVMDDGDQKGDNQLIRLRSASGHQILLHDTTGVVYIANGSGNVWMEFSANGSIDIYAGGGVNIRSRGDMNFHSDTNINMFARKQIKLSSVGKLVIDGGAVQTYADYDVQSQSRYGSITNKAPEGNIVSYAGLMQLHMATGQTHLTGSQVHFNSVPTSPDIVATYERTTVQDTAGTGTLRESIPDVNPANKYTYGPLVVDQNANISMSGMRVPTHEPYPFHFDKVVTFVGTDPSVLSNTPGTPEFIAQRNRTSDNPVIRIGQFQADLQYRLQKDGVGQVPTAVNKFVGDTNSQPSGDIQKIQQAANSFAQDYSKTYNLKDSGPFNISPISEGVSSTIQQTVSSLSGSNVNLLKNQVFVNQNGTLYSAGNLNQSITSSVNTVSGALGTVKNITTTAGGVLNTYNAVKNKLSGNAGDAIYTDYGNTTVTDNTSVSSFISTSGPFGGGNIFGSTSGGGNVFSPGGVTGLPTIPGLPGISVPGLGQVNQVLGLYNQGIGTYNVVNKVYKNIFGSDITSITDISSLTDSLGNNLASITSSIGDVFTPSALGDLAGFTSDAGIIADIGFSI